MGSDAGRIASQHVNTQNSWPSKAANSPPGSAAGGCGCRRGWTRHPPPPPGHRAPMSAGRQDRHAWCIGSERGHSSDMRGALFSSHEPPSALLQPKATKQPAGVQVFHSGRPWRQSLRWRRSGASGGSAWHHTAAVAACTNTLNTRCCRGPRMVPPSVHAAATPHQGKHMPGA